MNKMVIVVIDTLELLDMLDTSRCRPRNNSKYFG